MRLAPVFALAALLAAAPLAQAQAPMHQHWFVGGGYGNTDVDPRVTTGLITSGTVDGKDSGYKIYGGYQFNPYFGLELAYVDLGTVKYSGVFADPFGTLPVTGGTIDIDGFYFAVLGSYPVSSSFSLFGKIGIYSWDMHARDTTGGLPFSAAEYGADVYLGVGAAFYFTRNVGLRVEWERYKLNSDNADMLSAGVIVRF